MIDGFSPITITLESGRLLRVDMLLIEPTYLPLDSTAYKEMDLPLLAKRPGLGGVESSWYESGPLHFKIPQDLVESEEPYPVVLISALLYSEPVSADKGFSELMLIFMVAWQRFGNIEELLQEALRDVDWEVLAKDRPMHLKRDSNSIQTNFIHGEPHRGQIH